MKNQFTQLKVHCLCHPGNKVCTKMFNGQIQDFDPFFLKIMSVFVEEVISSLSPLSCMGVKMTAPLFGLFQFILVIILSYLNQMCELFMDKTALPSGEDLINLQNELKEKVVDEFIAVSTQFIYYNRKLRGMNGICFIKNVCSSILLY